MASSPRFGMTIGFDQGPRDALALVLLPGLLSTSSVWRPVVAALASPVRVIGLDLPGHGGSPPAPVHTTLDDLATDVVACLDRCGLERAILGGTSLGAMIAIAVAARVPERTAGLALLSASVRAESPERLARQEATLRAVARLGVKPVLGGLAAVMFGATTRATHPELVAAWRAEGERIAPDAVLSLIETAMTRPDLRDRLPSVRCPTLVLGGVEDRLVPVGDPEAIAAAIPGARFAVISSAGHLAPIEAPEEVARHLDDLIDETAGRRIGV